MGVIRKTMSVSTLGLVNFRSKKERRVLAEERAAKAAETVARAQANLANAQAQVLARQAVPPANPQQI